MSPAIASSTRFANVDNNYPTTENPPFEISGAEFNGLAARPAATRPITHIRGRIPKTRGPARVSRDTECIRRLNGVKWMPPASRLGNARNRSVLLLKHQNPGSLTQNLVFSFNKTG